MTRDQLIRVAACAVTCLWPATAFAQPGNAQTTTGSASAEMVAVGNLTKIQDLRFGSFMRPTVASTMTITPGGAISSTGSITAGMAIPQLPAGRGPARFLVDGSPNRLFLLFTPNTVTISSGANSMLVDNVTSSSGFIGLLDAGGQYDLYMGGRLNAAANQVAGSYSGNFTITVFFL